MHARKALRGLKRERYLLAIGILDYLERHPKATDTVEGIRRFWLEGDLAGKPRQEVEEVVIELVARSLMERRLKPDGEWVYGLAAERSPEAAPEAS